MTDDLMKVVVPTQPESTPQLATKRYPWSRTRVQHKPTRAERKAFKKLVNG